MATAEELVRINGQAHEILKRVGNDSLDALTARKALQDIIEGKHSGSDQHPGICLLSLDEQLDRLRAFNSQCWDNRLTDEQFAAVDTSSDHVQSVNDLEVLYVDFGLPEDNNVEMWWRVLVWTQSEAWRYREVVAGMPHLRLATVAHHYMPGIHRVRLNLMAYWGPDESRSVHEVRESARANGETLAAAEVLAAYGLHGQLLQQMGGEYLSKGEYLSSAELGGYEVTIPGTKGLVPYLEWKSLGHRVYLGLDKGNIRNCYSTCPVVLES